MNWLRTDDTGRYLWPGYGESIRVIDWMFERLAERCGARVTPLGGVPRVKDLDRRGLDVSPDRIDALLHIDAAAWLGETRQSMEFLRRFGARLPTALKVEHQQLVKRLMRAVGTLKN